MVDEEIEKEDTLPQEVSPAVEEKIRSERDMIKDAELAAERLERANRKMDELLNRQERLMVRETLGGKAEAGKPEKKEESPKEYKERVMRGEL